MTESERPGDETADGEVNRPVMSKKAVESAAWTARAVTTSSQLERIHSDGTANDDYPYIGFWKRFTRSLEKRWKLIKKERASENTGPEEQVSLAEVADD